MSSIKSLIISSLSLTLLLFCVSASHAKIFRWIDDSGTLHFTDQYYKVPEKYRSKPPVDRYIPVTPDEKIDGELAYHEKCAGCHDLQGPEHYRELNLPRLMRDMEEEMDDEDMEPLTPDEREAIIDYLSGHTE